eukprot:CAMPEP_0114165498 /NCGR_PEP_ID=MMETSP0043_2-20121206/31288_1 /TAXON_ID=464988 /ORGANISM="Hemiselmis andersenii, Strain CCMP644" /LENGTH=154 /DNA_ID=CAMNT_0001262339 /DNA_START=60 /DNA_END=521 /DNA_ORIENTATION=+
MQDGDQQHAHLDPDTLKRVHKALPPNQQCRIAIPVSKDNTTIGSTSRVLAVVSPSDGRQQRESALLVLKSKIWKGGYQIRLIIPILSDFRVSLRGENQFEVSWLSSKRETRSYTARSTDALASFLTAVSNSHQVACLQSFEVSTVANGASHAWL